MPRKYDVFSMPLPSLRSKEAQWTLLVEKTLTKEEHPAEITNRPSFLDGVSSEQGIEGYISEL